MVVGKKAILFLFVFIFSTSLTAAPRDPSKYFFNESWGDFPEELVIARDEGKKAVLLFFEMDECPFCHYMKNTVLNQPEVQEYFRKHFRIVSVDIEGDIEITNFKGEKKTQKDFAFREHRVRATPVFVFFDLTGKRIYKHIGKTSDVAEFLLMGRYIASETYKKMSFTRYKRSKRKSVTP